MPVYRIVCPDCRRESRSLVLQGTRMPSEWVCSACGSRRAALDPKTSPEPHPWETGHGKGCPCCSG